MLTNVLQDRPILWVGHSLGGLVIKAALIQAANHRMRDNGFDDLGLIYSATIGVLFLGTPHRGSSHEALGQVATLAAKLTFHDANSQLMGTLAVDSHILEQQRSEFVQVCKNLEIVCFYEERPTGVAGLVCKTVSPIPTVAWMC